MLENSLIDLYKQIELVPSQPGIYKFFDLNDEILYVGKAVNLKSRVSSYFSSHHVDRPHIIPMIDLIKRIDFIVTDNEVEALVLESALIKQYKPKYNIREKDDKSYSWIFINTREKYPTVKIIRTLDRKNYKKGRLFGPYPSGRATRQIFRYIRRAHPFCTCKNPKEPCLYYHIGLCNNPIFGEYSEEEYRHQIDEIIKFLQGTKNREISSLVSEMNQLALNKEFEKAAILRDRIEDLRHLGREKSWYQDESEFIAQKKKSIELSMNRLANDLGSYQKIKRIECYDISNLQGKEAFGSMTVFDEGKIDSSLYRIFKIRGKNTPDDYEMLREVLTRRIKYINLPGEDSLNRKPTIVLIDGGKGQVSSVAPLIPDGIILMGISKGRSMKKKKLRSMDQFWIYLDGNVESVKIREPKILIQLRDEAHRFSLKHHRNSRAKVGKVSALDTIEGIGPIRKKQLKKEFGTVSNIRELSVEEINKVLKNKGLSVRVYESLRKK